MLNCEWSGMAHFLLLPVKEPLAANCADFSEKNCDCFQPPKCPPSGSSVIVMSGVDEFGIGHKLPVPEVGPPRLDLSRAPQQEALIREAE